MSNRLPQSQGAVAENSSFQLYVFGSNGEGQLGIPAAEIVNTPTRVLHFTTDSCPFPLDKIRYIRGGDNHTLFLTQSGVVYGVGDNRKGQLRRDKSVSRLEPFHVLALDNSFADATCESSAYVELISDLSSSGVKIYGSNSWGELGSYDETSSQLLRSSDETFAHLLLPGRVVDFAAGVWHYVVIMQDGSAYGWGKGRLGQLGDALSGGKVMAPTKIEGLPFNPKKVVCGKDFTYLAGVPAEGKHHLLGKDKFNIISNMPEHVKNWKDIGATWHAIFVLFDDGTLTAWGKENMWQLLPPNLPLLDKIAVGSDHILAVTKEGRLISWGWGKHGNCGDLSNVGFEMKNDMVSGFWNEISIPGEIETIGAGYCTSFVVTKQR
ncbi:regulator of chromosome condensation 1/beta-lactamase-inhibitor protein II [Alternaria rosae]|uniref:regulator of chromosome condensation 1/beta-lactamase-inhibitor protein II n=1 Tax=Alternaria rosae TaxID=1187941 RepID=UPI001E8E3067|nr:regulator of chromosome condensation 1/beta-lactamase-inhibitor protein II [Alternaria rosae]KAH6859141.1 regulator of chromosome condensation 1/beta-lactamase-inhibitor protein II [Alternaria rosae]